MSEVKLTRLNKVLREFNISLDRAVEFLASNDHAIEARPTTKISEEQYSLFLNEFSSDKSSKVESHGLSEEKRKQKEELRIQIEKEQEEKIKKQNALIEAKAEVKKPIQLGKIDLDQFNKKPKASLDKKAPKLEENLKDKEIKKVGSEKAENVVEKKDDTNIKTQYKKLSGLKTVGDKIDLGQFKKSKPSVGANKPSYGSSSSKRKRIRVTKDPVKPSSDSNKRNFTKQPRTKASAVEPSEIDVKKQIRETLEKLQGRSSTSKGAKYRKEIIDQPLDE